MIRLLADESLSGVIIKQVRRQLPESDFLSATDIALLGAEDPEVLEWAARNGRIVVASDVETMIGHAYQRVKTGRPMPGLVHVPQWVSIGVAVGDLMVMLECSDESEWLNRVVHLPF